MLGGSEVSGGVKNEHMKFAILRYGFGRGEELLLRALITIDLQFIFWRILAVSQDADSKKTGQNSNQ
jgi:hypothetical protein